MIVEQHWATTCQCCGQRVAVPVGTLPHYWVAVVVNGKMKLTLLCSCGKVKR